MLKRKWKYIGLLTWFLMFIIVVLGVDPDSDFLTNIPFGAGLIAHFSQILIAVSGVVTLYFMRKIFFDYVDADFHKLFRIASKEPVGAGLALIAIALHIIAYSIVIMAILN